MAKVYLAVQENFQREVAVKILAARLLSDTSFGVRFLREARIVAQLSHQNIVPVFDVGQHGDCHYIAMELLPGGDLKQRLAKGMPLPQCLDIVLQIASALHYASGKNFVHRDIKPENILFREDGSAVVSDFGIARSTTSETNMTLTGTIIGTPSYMSPEQAQAQTLDGRSDLYSLGIILFEMLTGNVPFTADSAISIGLKHITDAIPELPADVADFQEFIDKALAKSPEDRFQTGQDFIDALQELEHDLNDGGSATTIITPGALKRQRNKSSRRTGGGTTGGRARGKTAGGRGRGAAGRTRTGSRTQTRRSTLSGQQSSAGRKGLVAASIVGVLAIAGAGGWWAYDQGFLSGGADDGQQFNARTLELIEQAEDAMAEGRFYEPFNDSAQYYYTTALALAPRNVEAIAGVESLINSYLDKADAALRAGSSADLMAWLDRAEQIGFYASDSKLMKRQEELKAGFFQLKGQKARIAERQQEIQELLAQAKEALANDRLTSPIDDNAYDRFQTVLAIDPSNKEALSGIATIAATYLTQAREEAEKFNISRARILVAAAIQIDSLHPQLKTTGETIDKMEERQQQQEMAEAQTVEDAEKNLLRDREEAKKQKALAITELLASAGKDFKRGNLQTSSGDDAVGKYRQVLGFDPSNLDALEGLQKVGEQYIVLAGGALAQKDVTKAGDYLDIAQKLVPGSRKLFSVRRNLLDTKEELARLEDLRRQREAQIKKLLAGARTDESKGRLSSPMGNNALEKYSRALAVDSTNKTAKVGRDKIVSGLVKDARSNIVARKFDRADVKIGTLARFYPKGKDTIALQSSLDKAKKIYAQQQKLLAALSKKTNKLASKAISEKNNRELRALYSEMLRIDKIHKPALQGLLKIGDFDLTLATSAIEVRNYPKAKDYVQAVAAYAPSQPKLAAVQQVLAVAEAAASKADGYIADAEKGYSKPDFLGDNDVARTTLKSAYTKIQLAKKADPEYPKVAEAIGRLENKYVEAIQYFTKKKSFDRGGSLVTDALAMDLSKARINEQKTLLEARKKEVEAQEKKKKLTRQMGIF